MYTPGKRGVASELVTASRIVHIGRANVWDCHFTGSNIYDAADVYDGVDANGRLKFPFGNPNAFTDTFDPVVPVYFDQGIYVALGAGTNKIWVVYEPLGDLDDLTQMVAE